MAFTGSQQGRLIQLIIQDLRARGADSMEVAVVLFFDFIQRTRAQQKAYLMSLVAAQQAANTDASNELPATLAAKQAALAADNTELSDLDTEIGNLS